MSDPWRWSNRRQPRCPEQYRPWVNLGARIIVGAAREYVCARRDIRNGSTSAIGKAIWLEEFFKKYANCFVVIREDDDDSANKDPGDYILRKLREQEDALDIEAGKEPWRG